MSLAAALARAPRCFVVNVATAESKECLFNPADLTEKIQVNWSRLTPLGLSHQVLQFQNTSNRQLGDVEFYLDRWFSEEIGAEPDIMDFRAFMRSLTVPAAAATAPPRALFVWPGVITIECVVGSVEFHYRQIAGDGRVLVYTATVSFEEILDTRVTSEELRRDV